MFVAIPHQENDTPADNVQMLLLYCIINYSWCTVGLHCPSQSAFGSSLKSKRRNLLIQCEKGVDGVGKLAGMLLLYCIRQWFLNWVRPNPRGSVRL